MLTQLFVWHSYSNAFVRKGPLMRFETAKRLAQNPTVHSYVTDMSLRTVYAPPHSLARADAGMRSIVAEIRAEEAAKASPSTPAPTPTAKPSPRAIQTASRTVLPHAKVTRPAQTHHSKPTKFWTRERLSSTLGA